MVDVTFFRDRFGITTEIEGGRFALAMLLSTGLPHFQEFLQRRANLTVKVLWVLRQAADHLE